MILEINTNKSKNFGAHLKKYYDKQGMPVKPILSEQA